MSKEKEQIIPKVYVLQNRYEVLLEQSREKGLMDEQKHIEEEDTPEKDYWHYGYAIALRDIDRNFHLIEKTDEEKGGE